MRSGNTNAKKRELKAQIAREGFVYLPKRGKGSHERWKHPLLKKTLTIPGKDGGDVPPYLEKQVTQLLAELAEIETQQENKQDDSI
ncbi:MAG: type II toxin-antitoxin system HicA family toxin [Okeania sp. SIO2D1]|nr:type II toxin-antitoxin system HicA family toxin [Okeania sp. SIO2D1]